MSVIEKDKVNRRNAVISGILFILATASGIMSVYLLGSTLDGSNYLVEISLHANKIILAALLELTMATAIGGIAVLLYSILKDENESIALGYVVARLFEAVPVILAAILLLALLMYSQEFAGVNTPDAQYYLASGSLLLAAREHAELVGTQFFFSLTAIILNFSMYRSKLIPRFLSAWGLLGAGCIFTASLMTFFGVIGSFSTIAIIMYLPIAVQEMVFAVWLIVKGFKPSETPSAAVIA